jgi:nucleoside-diphosphate-sugar epimerase
MKILLTGATGFIGRHVLQNLLSQPAEIHTTSRHPIPKGAPNHTHHILDLTDPFATNAALAKIRPTHLLHLAWDVTHGQFWTSPSNLDWLAASLTLYRAFARHGGRRLAVTGTFAEYDWSSEILDESKSPIAPASLYGQSKHALHTLLATAAKQQGISLAWPRLFMLYGPAENPARFIPSIARALLQNRPATVQNGAAIRDFLHVTDAARALTTVLLSPHEGAINIASGHPVALAEIATQIARLTPHPEILTITQGTPSTLTANTTLLNNLGFKPQYALGQGLLEVIESIEQEALF